MSDCCSSSGKAVPPRKHKCPVNGIEYAEVPTKTILHHLRHPWEGRKKVSATSFARPRIAPWYFGEDGSTIAKAEVRGIIGSKEAWLGLCSCETSNPSGRCCLKDFPRGEQP